MRAYTCCHAAIRFYHFFYGPFLWNRPAPADAGEIGKEAVADYRIREHREGDVVANSVHVYGSKWYKHLRSESLSKWIVCFL